MRSSCLAGTLQWLATHPRIHRGVCAGGGQWTFAKSFDTFCPLGPYIVPRSLVPDPQNLVVRCSINGKVTQEGNTRDMVFSCVTALLPTAPLHSNSLCSSLPCVLVAQGCRAHRACISRHNPCTGHGHPDRDPSWCRRCS